MKGSRDHGEMLKGGKEVTGSSGVAGNVDRGTALPINQPML